MATGLGAAGANAELDALVAAFPWVKLHIGDPGAAGTANSAVETTRKQPVWNAASGGSKTNSATVTWLNVAASEDYTHFTLWSASSGGTFGGSGVVTAAPVTSSGGFQVAPGDLVLSHTLAS